MIVLHPGCACVRTSAEDDDFQREGGVCVHLMILSNLRGFMFWSARYNIIAGQFGFARY